MRCLSMLQNPAILCIHSELVVGGVITFYIIARGWEDKSEMLKHCGYWDLPKLRPMVCSLEQKNKKLL